jgi:hypothetical protein
MPHPPHTTGQILALLADTPTRLAGLTAGCSPEQLGTPPEPGEWSVSELLAHLRACADVWGRSITRILAEDTPAFRYVSPRTWIRKTDYPDWAFDAALVAFTEQRAALIAQLEPLAPEAWHRTANVTKSGKSRVETVLSYAGGMADHELIHLEQIAHTVAAVRHVER